MRFVVFIVTLTLIPVPASRGGGKDDLKALDGVWLPQSAELAGQKFPDEVLKSMKVVLKGDKYVVHVGDQIDKGIFKIDAGKKPKAMDITGTDGPNKDKTFLAIYELNGNSLKLCYDLSGKMRPTEFKTAAETQLFLVNYQRAK